MPKTIKLKQKFSRSKSISAYTTCTILPPFIIMTPTLAPTPPQVLRRLILSCSPLSLAYIHFQAFFQAIFPTINILSLLYQNPIHSLRIITKPTCFMKAPPSTQAQTHNCFSLNFYSTYWILLLFIMFHLCMSCFQWDCKFLESRDCLTSLIPAINTADMFNE